MRPLFASAIFGLLLFSASGCRREASEPPPPPAEEEQTGPPGDLEPQSLPASAEIRGTGASIEGQYERSPDGDSVQAIRIAFSSDGGFTRTVARGQGVQVVERGTYVIDEKRRIALFVEGRDSASYSSAEVPLVYTLESEGDTLSLASEEAGTVKFKRTGAAPPASQGGPKGE